MEKMTIERFKELCGKIKKIHDVIVSGEYEELPEEEGIRLEEEFEAAVEEIQSSDLSDIPFEAWEGYLPLVEQLNLEGTGANIDFNYIHIPEILGESKITLNLKGCNVRNFSFDKTRYRFSEESFDKDFVDEAVITHPEAFIGRTITDEQVRQRFNRGRLTLKDVIDHNLADKVTLDNLDYDSRDIVKKIGLEEALKIDYAILSSEELFRLFDRAMYDVESIEDYDQEKIKRDVITAVGEDFKDRYSFKKAYTQFEEVPFIRDEFPEYYIDFPEGTEDLKTRYLERKLYIKDVVDHPELFKGKKFLDGMADYYLKNSYPDLTEEKIEYLMEHEPKITQYLATRVPIKLFSIADRLDLEKTPEELSEFVKTEVANYVKAEAEHIDFSDSGILEFIDYRELTLSLLSSEYDISRTTEFLDTPGNIEVLKENGISPVDLKDGSLVKFFKEYGLDRVLEFDRENGGFFSNNGFAVAKIIDDAFFHYAGNTHDTSRTIYTRNIDLATNRYKEEGPWDLPYTKEAFEEAVRRMIVFGPTDGNYSDRPLNHRAIVGPFRDKYPELYVSEEMPDKWKEMFYAGKVDFDEIRYSTPEDEPSIREILSKDRDLAFRRVAYYLEINDMSDSTLLEIIKENGSYLSNVEEINLKGLSHDEIVEKVRQGVINGILRGRVQYGPKAPDYVKEAHPELFLDEQAPEELKGIFYKKFYEEVPTAKKPSDFSRPQLSIALFEQHPEYMEFLEGKSLDYAYIDSKLQVFIQEFGKDECFKLIKEQPEVMKIISTGGRPAIQKFKKLLDERPEFYAKKELEELEGYTKDEIEEIVSGQETTNERILEGRKLLESKKEKFRDFILTTPGYVLHCPEDKRDDFKFTEFKELERLSKFTVSDNYRRDTAEQIITTMYCFLGYAGTKEVLKLPEVDEAELEEAIRTTGVAVSGIYENVYNVKGNLKVLGSLFDKLAPSLPGGKANFLVYQSIDRKLSEGFSGSIEDLITEALTENGIKQDQGRTRNIVKNSIAANTQEKMEIAKNPLEAFLAENVIETPETLKLITDTYMTALRKSFLEKECIDVEYIRQLLTKEYSRTKEDGEAYYSPHVTDYLESLVEFTSGLNENPEFASLNKSVVDILKEEKEKIGKGWIRKLLNLKTRLTEKEFESLQDKLYGDDSKHKITAEKTLELKDKSEAGIEEAYIILKELELPGVFTFEKGEIMFAGLQAPYSENFKNFFLANMSEILRKPEFYTKFQVMHRRMDSVIKDSNINARFKAGNYAVQELLDDIENITYETVEPGTYELAYRAKKSNLTQEEFELAKEVHAKMAAREKQAVPPVEHKGKRYVGRILRVDDPLTLTIGNVTTCCQRFGLGQPGESSMLHSALEENGSVFVVEEIDEEGNVVNIVSQSWTWRNGDRVCFDNIEVPNTLISELKAKNAFPEIFEVYAEAARKMIEIDKMTLGKFLQEGKITKEQYDALVIKQVTVGKGCDDLIKNLPVSIQSALLSAKNVKPIEYGRIYSGIGSRELYVDSFSQCVLAQNDEALSMEHQKAPEDISIGYTRKRDVTRKKGIEIHQDLVQRVKDMNDRAGEETKVRSVLGSQESNNIAVITRDYSSPLNSKDLVLSFSEFDDWYVLASESDTEIKIEDSLLLPQSDALEQDKSLAKLEYLREVLGLARIADHKGKSLALDFEREGKFFDIEKLISIGILEKDYRGNLNVKDRDELNKLIGSLDERIEKENEARMVDTAIAKKPSGDEKDDQDEIDENR